MKHHRDQIPICDFITVETAGIKTIYVLYIIELRTRRVQLAECTSHPNQVWVSQQPRQLVWELPDRDLEIRFLIHDHDSKFTSSFDQVFSSEGVEVIHISYQTLKANAYVERWVRPGKSVEIISLSWMKVIFTMVKKIMSLITIMPSSIKEFTSNFQSQVQHDSQVG